MNAVKPIHIYREGITNTHKTQPGLANAADSDPPQLGFSPQSAMLAVFDRLLRALLPVGRRGNCSHLRRVTAERELPARFDRFHWK